MGLGSGGRQWNTSDMKTEIVMDRGAEVGVRRMRDKRVRGEGTPNFV